MVIVWFVFGVSAAHDRGFFNTDSRRTCDVRRQRRTDRRRRPAQLRRRPPARLLTVRHTDRRVRVERAEPGRRDRAPLSELSSDSDGWQRTHDSTRPSRPSWSAAGSAARSSAAGTRSLQTSSAASTTRHSRGSSPSASSFSPRMLSGISSTPSGSVTQRVAEVEEPQPAVDVEDVVLVQVVVVERERQAERRDLLGPPAYDGEVGAQAVGDVGRQAARVVRRPARRTARSGRRGSRAPPAARSAVMPVASSASWCGHELALEQGRLAGQADPVLQVAAGRLVEDRPLVGGEQEAVCRRRHRDDPVGGQPGQQRHQRQLELLAGAVLLGEPRAVGRGRPATRSPSRVACAAPCAVSGTDVPPRTRPGARRGTPRSPSATRATGRARGSAAYHSGHRRPCAASPSSARPAGTRGAG